MVAYSLVAIVGRASAANILGITVRELDKLVDIYDVSEKLTNLAEPGASITWAREIKNLNRKILTPTVFDAIIRKINAQEITNSKDLRKLRQILKDPVGKENFLSTEGSIESAIRTLGSGPSKKAHGLPTASTYRSLPLDPRYRESQNANGCYISLTFLPTRLKPSRMQHHWLKSMSLP